MEKNRATRDACVEERMAVSGEELPVAETETASGEALREDNVLDDVD